MSDSLRDQLLQAGFRAPSESKQKKSGASPGRKSGGGKRGRSRATSPALAAAGKQPTTRQGKGSSPASNASANALANASADEQAAIARRKALKAEIKALIDAAAIKDHQGESVYRFVLGQRIRELHVKDEIRQQLVSGALVITRLNGSTCLVPEETADAIRALNPDWAIVRPTDTDGETPEGYEQFTVPDDLQW